MTRALCLALCLLATANAQDPYRVAAGVEPEVRQAFAAAWRQLPSAHRQRIATLELTLQRAPALEVPADAPLAARLMGRAAHAWFSASGKTLTVTDAALRGARWSEPAPPRAQLASFLRGLSDVLEVELGDEPDGAALGQAWTAFVARCSGAFGGEWPADSAPGDPQVLTRFLQAGVQASLGGELPGLEALLIHELGHALQLGPSGERDRVAGFAALSGWVEVKTGNPADGYVGGGWGNEDPLTLIRLLLGGRRGPGATYAPAPGSSFPTLYARFDPREDFAECYRLALTDPEQLLRSAPAKLLALNALGWSAGVEAPPLLTTLDPEWSAQLLLGVEHLLGRRAPSPGTRDARAILRAARPLLEALDVPAGTRPDFELPVDLPLPVREAWGDGVPGIELEVRTIYFGSARLTSDLEALFARFRDHVDFDHGIALMRREAHPDAPFAEVIEKRSGDTALAFLRRYLADERPERLEAWLEPTEGAQQVLVLAALLARRPDDADLAKAFRALEPLSPYARALAAELLVAPELMAAPSETPSTPLRIALHLLQDQPGTSVVSAARARALARLARAKDQDREATAKRARAAVGAIALPEQRAKLRAEVEGILAR